MGLYFNRNAYPPEHEHVLVDISDQDRLEMFKQKLADAETAMQNPDLTVDELYDLNAQRLEADGIVNTIDRRLHPENYPPKQSFLTTAINGLKGIIKNNFHGA